MVLAGTPMDGGRMVPQAIERAPGAWAQGVDFKRQIPVHFGGVNLLQPGAVKRPFFRLALANLDAAEAGVALWVRA